MNEAAVNAVVTGCPGFQGQTPTILQAGKLGLEQIAAACQPSTMSGTNKAPSPTLKGFQCTVAALPLPELP
jgi:hypothetical protein